MKFMRRPDIDNVTRIKIAVQAFRGLGVYGELTRIAKSYRVSRLFVYKLLWQLMIMFELDESSAVTTRNIIAESDRQILLLRYEGKCSIESISQILERSGYPHASIGYISQRLAVHARAVPKDELIGAGIKFLLCDEIFTGNRSILITAEPGSLAILKIELVEKRDGETWKKYWQELFDEGLIDHQIVVSDQGVGLVKGCELAGIDSFCSGSLWCKPIDVKSLARSYRSQRSNINHIFDNPGIEFSLNIGVSALQGSGTLIVRFFDSPRIAGYP